MLIYNFQKEFLGIDEKDLKTLGFNTLEELRSEVTDFADLFVKTPGYVHNFKHVHWIDFVNYADVSEESKVLINVNSKTFKATLSIAPLFLIDNPSSPAYIINLNNLRPLSKHENDNLSSDVLDRELPKVETPPAPKPFTPAPEVAPAVHDTYDTPVQQSVPQEEEILSIDIDKNETEVPAINVEEQASVETHKKPNIPKVAEEDKALDVGDLSLDVFEEENTPQVVASTPEATTQKTKKVIKKEVVQEQWDNGYQYDPHIASKELGLPLDLIEEFIQDFIAQAKEFKPSIYTSIEEGDVDNVKILSHKLKGVAANLRIEDAHEVLSAVSATSDMDVIEENLNVFYKIIAKLAGEPVEKVVVIEEEEVEVAPEVPTETTEIQIDEDEPITLDFKDDEDELMDNIDISSELKEEEDDDSITLDFKDNTDDTTNTDSISDDDVPEKIDIPELADDDFLSIVSDEDEATKTESEEGSFHFSKSQAAKEIGIDEASFNELFDDFVEEGHTILQNIEESIENDNIEKCHNEALKFKGMSDNMRLNEFTNELETLIHSSDKEQLKEATQKIDTILTKISKMGA